MKQVEIIEAFDGYPNGRKVSFVEGAVETLSDGYADLIVGKGHARYRPEEAPPPPKPAGNPAAGAQKKDDAHEDE